MGSSHHTTVNNCQSSIFRTISYFLLSHFMLGTTVLTKKVQNIHMIFKKFYLNIYLYVHCFVSLFVKYESS